MENTSVQNVNNKKNIMFILLISVLTIVIAGMGVTLAFLTKNTEKRANNFTFGNVSIELTEKKWEELTPEDKIIYPAKTITKDPVITNNGENDAYVYMEVKVPMADVRTYDSNGTIKPAGTKELFTFSVNNNWESVEEYVENEGKENQCKVKLYAYKQPLNPKQSTPPLFENVVVINMLEGELKMNTSIEIPITAYAVQSDFVNSLEQTNFKKIFDDYVKEGG